MIDRRVLVVEWLVVAASGAISGATVLGSRQHVRGGVRWPVFDALDHRHLIMDEAES